MFLFQSDLWQYSERHVLLKNLLLDFFRGEEVSTINLTGLSYVISVTAIGDETQESPSCCSECIVGVLGSGEW